jgi:hypothetical protein
MVSISRVTNGYLFAACIAIISLSSGCAAPPYDEQTDKLISTLQSDVDGEIFKLLSAIELIKASSDEKLVNEQKKLASYPENVGAYNKIRVDFVSLRLRVNASSSDLSKPQIDQALQALNDNLFGKGSLEDVHKEENVPTSEFLLNQQNIIHQQISALLTYELILKNGQGSTSL